MGEFCLKEPAYIYGYVYFFKILIQRVNRHFFFFFFPGGPLRAWPTSMYGVRGGGGSQMDMSLPAPNLLKT